MTPDRSGAAEDGVSNAGVAQVALLGLGLVGGSIARALRGRSGETRLVAWSPSGNGPRAALAAGVVDAAASSVGEATAGAELVVLAGPPLAILELIEVEAGTLRKRAAAGATMTDVASTKRAIMAAADRARLPFVGGHPMAGREAAGFEAAESELFDGRPWVVVPGALARETDLERVAWLARTVGARVVRLTAAEHDAAVAAISHLPLVLSAALVEAVAGADDWPAARELVATGWAGMTRLARGDAAMGAGILATNRAAVVERLRDFRTALDRWIDVLDAESSSDGAGPVALRSRLEAARATLEERDG